MLLPTKSTASSIPLHSSSSINKSPEKSLVIPEQRDFFHPDFFQPIGTDLSCTYSEEFYAAFKANPVSTQQHKMAMLVLEYMTVEDKARLPLFEGASKKYLKQVIPAIQEKLALQDTSDESLLTKFHIMNCASRLGYLNHRNLFDWSSSISLCKVSLQGMNLRNADLGQADLSGADLSGADLSGAILCFTGLVKAKLNYAILNNADMTSAWLSEADFSYAEMASVNLFQASMRSTNLSHANLTRADLSEAILINANLTDANLTKANLPYAILTQAVTTGAKFFEVDFIYITDAPFIFEK